jgi:hypothetical protein
MSFDSTPMRGASPAPTEFASAARDGSMPMSAQFSPSPAHTAFRLGGVDGFASEPTVGTQALFGDAPPSRAGLPGLPPLAPPWQQQQQQQQQQQRPRPSALRARAGSALAPGGDVSADSAPTGAGGGGLFDSLADSITSAQRSVSRAWSTFRAEAHLAEIDQELQLERAASTNFSQQQQPTTASASAFLSSSSLARAADSTPASPLVGRGESAARRGGASAQRVHSPNFRRALRERLGLLGSVVASTVELVAGGSGGNAGDDDDDDDEQSEETRTIDDLRNGVVDKRFWDPNVDAMRLELSRLPALSDAELEREVKMLELLSRDRRAQLTAVDSVLKQRLLENYGAFTDGMAQMEGFSRDLEATAAACRAARGDLAHLRQTFVINGLRIPRLAARKDRAAAAVDALSTLDLMWLRDREMHQLVRQGLFLDALDLAANGTIPGSDDLARSVQVADALETKWKAHADADALFRMADAAWGACFAGDSFDADRYATAFAMHAMRPRGVVVPPSGSATTTAAAAMLASGGGGAQRVSLVLGRAMRGVVTQALLERSASTSVDDIRQLVLGVERDAILDSVMRVGARVAAVCAMALRLVAYHNKCIAQLDAALGGGASGGDVAAGGAAADLGGATPQRGPSPAMSDHGASRGSSLAPETPRRGSVMSAAAGHPGASGLLYSARRAAAAAADGGGSRAPSLGGPSPARSLPRGLFAGAGASAAAAGVRDARGASQSRVDLADLGSSRVLLGASASLSDTTALAALSASLSMPETDAASPNTAARNHDRVLRDFHRETLRFVKEEMGRAGQAVQNDLRNVAAILAVESAAFKTLELDASLHVFFVLAMAVEATSRVFVNDDQTSSTRDTLRLFSKEAVRERLLLSGCREIVLSMVQETWQPMPHDQAVNAFEVVTGVTRAGYLADRLAVKAFVEGDASLLLVPVTAPAPPPLAIVGAAPAQAPAAAPAPAAPPVPVTAANSTRLPAAAAPAAPALPPNPNPFTTERFSLAARRSAMTKVVAAAAAGAAAADAAPSSAASQQQQQQQAATAAANGSVSILASDTTASAPRFGRAKASLNPFRAVVCGSGAGVGALLCELVINVASWFPPLAAEVPEWACDLYAMYLYTVATTMIGVSQTERLYDHFDFSPAAILAIQDLERWAHNLFESAFRKRETTLRVEPGDGARGVPARLAGSPANSGSNLFRSSGAGGGSGSGGGGAASSSSASTSQTPSRARFAMEEDPGLGPLPASSGSASSFNGGVPNGRAPSAPRDAGTGVPMMYVAPQAGPPPIMGRGAPVTARVLDVTLNPDAFPPPVFAGILASYEAPDRCFSTPERLNAVEGCFPLLIVLGQTVRSIEQFITGGALHSAAERIRSLEAATNSIIHVGCHRLCIALFQTDKIVEDIMASRWDTAHVVLPAGSSSGGGVAAAPLQQPAHAGEHSLVDAASEAVVGVLSAMNPFYRAPPRDDGGSRGTTPRGSTSQSQTPRAPAATTTATATPTGTPPLSATAVAPTAGPSPFATPPADFRMGDWIARLQQRCGTFFVNVAPHLKFASAHLRTAFWRHFVFNVQCAVCSGFARCGRGSDARTLVAMKYEAHFVHGYLRRLFESASAFVRERHVFSFLEARELDMAGRLRWLRDNHAFYNSVDLAQWFTGLPVASSINEAQMRETLSALQHSDCVPVGAFIPLEVTEEGLYARGA